MYATMVYIILLYAKRQKILTTLSHSDNYSLKPNRIRLIMHFLDWFGCM